MNFELITELEISKAAAIEASMEILKIYNTDFDVEYKDDNSPLTIADKKSNDLIVSKISGKFPKHAILSEESSDDKSRLNNDWCWIIDPLDGTKEFLKRNGEFTVNIALSYKKQVVMGVVFVPVTGEMFYASKGNGAYYEKDGKKIKIKVPAVTDKITLMKSRSHASESLKKLIEENKEKIGEIKSSGSSIKGCLIAKGEAEVYYRFGPTMEWDTAAMQCIVEEAGGIFKQLDDTEMKYNRENSRNDKGFYIINRIENKLKIN